MKKTAVSALLLVLVLSVTACSVSVTSYADAKSVLDAVWTSMDEKDTFAVGGGDSGNLTTDGPGAFDVTKTEELNVTLALPSSQTANIEDAASIVHMMNANMFTGAAYKVKEGTDVSAFARAYKENLDARRWIDGFPEKFVVISSGDYLITAFGYTQNVDAFSAKAVKILPDAKKVLVGNITAT